MIYVLPGMGAGSGMFSGSWRQLPDSIFVDWPPYQGEQTLNEIAARIIHIHGIPDGSIVVGTSLGGMVACEIARLRRLRQLILIGSAIHPSEISTLLTALRPFAKYAPVNLLQMISTSVPSELARMFAGTDPEFIRTTIQAIFKWNGLDSSQQNPLRIHGKYDLVIPPPNHVDLLIQSGHLIAMTHARECCDFIIAHGDNAPSSNSP